MTRLRPVNDQDEYGYVSRVDGDRKLVDLDTQETFFAQICTRYSLTPFVVDNETSQVAFTCNTHKDSCACNQSTDSSNCLASLRKLREGIVSSGRSDDFAIDVFECTAKYAILADHHESYLPVMQYLLVSLYPSAISQEKYFRRKQVIGELFLLHLCSLRQYTEFHMAKLQHKILGTLADDVLRSLVRTNWVAWHRLNRSPGLSTLHKKMIDKTYYILADSAVSRIAVAYVSVEVAWIVKVCGERWQERNDTSHWQIEDSRLTLKKSKPKKAPLV